MHHKITGIAASSGVAIAKAFIHLEPNVDIEKTSITDVSTEIEKLTAALEKSKEELRAIKDQTEASMGADKAEIFAAHLLVLDDPELVDGIKGKIENEQMNAEYALKEVSDMFVSMFESMDNEYMKERAADIRDVSKRVLGHLIGVETGSLATIAEETVIIAEDLTPSDTAQLNKQFVKGFATDIGGRTSHSAIMSRSLEIPAVVGTKEVTEKIQHGDMVIVDGIEGIVIVNPTEEEVKAYEEKRAAFEKQKQEWAKLVGEPSTTKDGAHVELAANIGTPKDVDGVLANGGEGIGLYRTEFLYMDRDQLPTEEEQFEAYKEVVQRMDGKPVVIRTLDIGGDKELSYLQLPKELNPFLGFRAIRLCLEKQDIFRTQLRALLRASTYGNLKVMFPMIATLEELRQAKAIMQEEKDKLLSEGVDVSDSIEVGIMVEIPSTAVAANLFAKEVDFFSIGTNDLIQYTMAADRMNERVSYLYQPYHPAILRLVDMVIKAAHSEGKWVGMCGEMAGDEVAIPLLLGLGLDEFSMSATSILPARSQLLKLSKEELKPFAQKVLMLDTAEEVEQLVKKTYLK
ncbi:phosphoenolpyruvate--protein phosphotransferase [Halalkalibacterium halodurans]|uniref:phosphoenolpyruvate--protein phosphotransferase n=1 Tax=Halalkalibacterium halodurans TaxID=86665 RepID=UPI002AAA5472|nr:phosphoenolpyruvate--protein phosphotransferase [Halalkalibacterium halodurans]MDY7223618.1 phosphoenolpyruvate--protein phosphotransferase [Halalkalibacterium halodurans]MDY7242839.1 phosphoenolpyruvate--protein phosphotransferase [Halalkalibacterium halodurans]MED4164858.1 phosphoenolpyruvate--protein phosphotransferase [Halalkalibacterium halodurans]